MSRDTLLLLALGTCLLAAPAGAAGPPGPVRNLADWAEVSRGQSIAVTRDDEEFVALAPDGENGVWIGWIAYRTQRDRDERILKLRYPPADFREFHGHASGDQVRVRRRLPDGRLEPPLALTGADLPISGLAMARAGNGQLWAFYSLRTGEAWELFGVPFSAEGPGKAILLGRAGGPDLDPVAVTDARGRIWVAWQGVRTERLQILVRRQEEDGSFAPEEIVSSEKGSAWAPALAATREGGSTPEIAIAWDSYRGGDYDVTVQRRGLDGKLLREDLVAASPHFEASPRIGFDSAANLWIAWREAGAQWGKDFGFLIGNLERGLFQERRIRILRLGPGGERWRPVEQPGASLLNIAPTSTITGSHGVGRAGKPLASNVDLLGDVVVDAHDRPWLVSLSRDPHAIGGTGYVFDAWVTFYDGARWSLPLALRDSAGFRFPPVEAVRNGKKSVLVATSGDGRRKPDYSDRRIPTGPVLRLMSDNIDSHIRLWSIPVPAPGSPMQLQEAEPLATKAHSPAQAQEDADVQRMRAARTSVNGRVLQLARGDLHRHTEFSSDGGVDGTLEDMMRYSIDAAQLDFVVNSDHDNGNGREFPWWLTQKAIDKYTFSPTFTGLHGYERSVRYPEGHRNLLFKQRGVGILPKLPRSKHSARKPARDTNMLYDFLEETDGLAFPHTSATRMGTDWRNHHPEREPMVEVYQGARQSSEREGAPRAISAQHAYVGYRPAGFVNHALNQGYHFAFYASSDHFSTHVSYAMVWTPERNRDAIFEAIRRGHVYGATDNILGEFRMQAGDTTAFLGEEATVDSAPTYHAKLHGTAPFRRIVFLHDDEEVHVVENRPAETEVSWTDAALDPGASSWTYVRGEQVDGELVWLSPIRVTRRPTADGPPGREAE